VKIAAFHQLIDFARLAFDTAAQRYFPRRRQAALPFRRIC
jgi:hypothetical protein